MPCPRAVVAGIISAAVASVLLVVAAYLVGRRTKVGGEGSDMV